MERSLMQLLRRSGFLLASTLLAALTIFTAPPAGAHTTLVSSSPSNGEIVSIWPEKVVLNFAEDLQTLSGQQVNFVTVSNAQGQQVSGKIVVVNNVVTAELLPNSVPGLVLVNYRVAAQDGHVVEGEFTFTNGKNSEVTPSSSPTITVVAHQETKGHTGIYATTTVLIVLALLFGLWVYKRD